MNERLRFVFRVIDTASIAFYSDDPNFNALQQERQKIAKRYEELKSGGYSFQESAERARVEWMQDYLYPVVHEDLDDDFH